MDFVHLTCPLKNEKARRFDEACGSCGVDIDFGWRALANSWYITWGVFHFRTSTAS
jgi:hypothetical protein